jgi:hypothetical protein
LIHNSIYRVKAIHDETGDPYVFVVSGISETDASIKACRELNSRGFTTLSVEKDDTIQGIICRRE